MSIEGDKPARACIEEPNTMGKTRIAVLCMTGLLVLLAGCQTSPLTGTKWSVVELWGPDKDAYPDATEMIVEFRPDGRVITTTTYKDGRKTVEDEERYIVDAENGVLTLKAEDREIVAMYRFDGKQLRVHSERFIVLADPVEK